MPVAVLCGRSCRDVPAEGYRLEISPSGVVLSCGDAAGEFYGRQTVRQLAGPDAFRAASIGGPVDAVRVIEDHPRFGWRGCLLDVARHFRTKAEVLRFIDLLAAHKLNVLNLHLTDDQGWRFEVPFSAADVGGRLAAVVDGGQRGRADGRPHGGFYTGDDLREIVAYAAARAITVVPEIDIPGHARAAMAAYPALGTGSSYEIWTAWGISTSLLSPTESTLDFFRKVFDHLLEIFPSQVIALGGDETPGATDEHRGFIRQLAEHLVSRGRTPMGWDEVLDIGGLPPMVIGSWRDEGRRPRCFGRPRRGDVPGTARVPGPPPVAGPGRADPGRHGPHAGRRVRVRAGVDRSPAARGAGAGVERAPGHVRRVDYMAFPRLSAFAEVAWTNGARDYEEFLPRLRDHHLPRLDALGVEYRPLDGPHPWQTRPGVPGRPR